MVRKRSLRVERTGPIISLLILFLSLGMNVPAALGSPEIKSIEVNQALGVQYQSHQYYVAGKNTVVRAFLSEPVTVSKRANLLGILPNTQAVVKNNGNVVATLSPKPNNAPTSVVDFLCPGMKECGNWAPGTYDFIVTVQGQTLTKSGVVFSSRRTFKILAVPLKTNYGGREVDYPDQKWKKLWTYTRDVYPVAADAVNWVERELLDLSDGSKYDLNTKSGRKGVWTALRDLNPTHCPPVGKTSGPDCYDLIVGFIPENPPGLAGYTYGRPANIVTGTDPDAAPTVAHEAAHLFEIGDTYKKGSINCDVNPAPDGWKGTDWNDDTRIISCEKGAVGYQDIGTKIFAASHPYDVNGRGPLGDMADYMGSSGSLDQFWTTPEVYDWLFTQFAPQTKFASVGVPTSQRLIAYSGSIRATDSAITLDPWTSYSDTADIPDTKGTYTIEALSATDQVLATQALEVNFYVLTNPPSQVSVAPFQGTMRFPVGTTKFQIVKGDNVLSQRAVNPDPPSVSDVTPTAAGASMSGINNITWNYANPGGSKLTYKVEYNPDITNSGSDWEVLAAGLDQNQWSQDFDDLPGGAHAQIRVTATDGVNAASAVSAVFVVPSKSPEIYIEALEWGNDYELGDEVLLKAEAYDLKDGWLPDDGIVWSSNINGVLGNGSILVVESLNPGEHTITATATNSSGLSSADQVKLTVSACTFAINPYTMSFQSRGGSKAVQVTASQGMGQSAVCSLTDDDLSVKTCDDGKWLSAKVTSFADNQGAMQVSILPNDSVYVRTGSVLVMGNEVDVTQDGAPCSLKISPAQAVFHETGGNGTINVSTPRGCVISWTAISDSQWIEITSGSRGTDNGTVTFSILPSTVSTRKTGHITINDKTFTVTVSP